MERIRNIDTLDSTLSNEDPLWQRRVFDETGVVVLPWEEEKPYWGLISSCGFADLEDDAEYCWVDGRDASIYCEITSVEQLIDYIREMDTYHNALKDVDLGGFNKSDLFWAIYYRILLLNRYPDDYDPYLGGSPVFGMKAIEGPGCSTSQDLRQNELYFKTSVVGVDELGVITINLSDHPSQDEIVDAIAEELRDLDMGKQEFKYDRNAKVITPKTYEEVMNSLKMIRF